MLDDDTARGLALFAGLDWEDDDHELLAPLIDATIVWAEEEQLDRIAAPIVEALWADGLRETIERALDDLAERGSTLAAAVPAARADLALGAGRSRLVLAYAKQAAVDLTADAMLPGSCLCCFDDVLGIAPPETREQIAVDAAVAVIAQRDRDFGTREPTDDELTAARERIREIAALARRSLPRLSAALQGVDVHTVWRAAHAERRAAAAARN